MAAAGQSKRCSATTRRQRCCDRGGSRTARKGNMHAQIGDDFFSRNRGIIWRSHQTAIVEEHNVLGAAQLGSNKVAIDVDGTELVFDDSDALPMISLKNVVEERRLAGAVDAGARITCQPFFYCCRPVTLQTPAPDGGSPPDKPTTQDQPENVIAFSDVCKALLPDSFCF